MLESAELIRKFTFFFFRIFFFFLRGEEGTGGGVWAGAGRTKKGGREVGERAGQGESQEGPSSIFISLQNHLFHHTQRHRDNIHFPS